MADLSRQSQRRTTQDRITNNRDAILPTRREDRVDPVRINASMRDAQRGNNLDELRRFFGQAQDTAEAYFRNDIAQTAKRAEGEYAQGMTDALGGVEMDPAKAEATAYQRAYYSVTASNRQTKFETETTQGLDDLIQSGATVEEIETYMQERSSAFIGEVSDLFESPEVRLQVGQRMQRWSNDVNARASGVLQERTDREMLDMTTGEVQAALGRGEGIDLLGTVGRLKEAGLDGVAVQEEVVNAVVAYAHPDRRSNRPLLAARHAPPGGCRGRDRSGPRRREQRSDRRQSIAVRHGRTRTRTGCFRRPGIDLHHAT